MRPTRVAARALRGVLVLAAATLLGSSLSQCAESQCRLNSECGVGRCTDGKCVRECFAPIDCPTDRPVCTSGMCLAGDAGVPDGGVPDGTTPPDGEPTDGTSPPTDTGTTPPVDSDVPDTTTSTDTPIDTPIDTPVVGTKAYLDGCAGDSDCASGMCTATAPRFCTKACTAHSQCVDGQICGAGRCRLDDTGKAACDTSTGSPCLEYCFGTSTAAHCTHTCSTASDCPAGYACSPVAGGKRVCVDIERPCSTATQCPSSVGFCGTGGVGCTATCSTASDCPNRLIGLSAYTCATVSGATVCVPPTDILGSDPIGATCPATGTNKCRSGGCDTGTTPPSCNQRCTPRGGCPPGYGCYPDGTGGSVSLICTVSGAGWLGDSCARARDCWTGLCDTSGYCTRLCGDGICPTGMSCKSTGLTADDGTAISICRK